MITVSLKTLHKENLFKNPRKDRDVLLSVKGIMSLLDLKQVAPYASVSSSVPQDGHTYLLGLLGDTIKLGHVAVLEQ